MLNISNLVDSGSFLVNGSLSCLVAYLHICSETDGGDQGGISIAKIDVFFAVYVWKKSLSAGVSKSHSTHANSLTSLPAWVPNNNMFNPLILQETFHFFSPIESCLH